MNKRKLLIGLASAAVLLAGLEGTVVPASADKTYLVTMLTGDKVRVTVPDGKTLAEVMTGPIKSAIEIPQAQAPAPPAPGPPPTEAASTTPEPAAPATQAAPSTTTTAPAATPAAESTPTTPPAVAPAPQGAPGTTPAPTASTPTTSTPTGTTPTTSTPAATTPTSSTPTTSTPTTSTPTTTTPTTSTPATPPPAEAPAPSHPAKKPSSGHSGRQKASDAKRAKRHRQRRRAAVVEKVKRPVGRRHHDVKNAHRRTTKQKKAGKETEVAPARTPGGSPTPSNPTFALAQPGPAPVGVPNFFIDKFRIPPFLLSIYQAAGIEYGVRWEVLAAINEIETDYGRNLNVSSAGAVGWMQFMPATWKTYGVDANNDGKKDPYNPVDAIFAAARYLKAAGADQDLPRAIFAYNHADWYVQSVLLRARLIGGMPSDLVGSLTGLTQGHFPVYAKARYADDLSERAAQRPVGRGQDAASPVDGSSARRGIEIFAKPHSPVVAVQDGKIVGLGRDGRLGRFIRLRDVYGNTYTYAHLESIPRAYPVPKRRTVSRGDVAKELGLPAPDPKPAAPATAGTQPKPAKRLARKAARRKPAPAPAAPTVVKERVFAHPRRPAAYEAGGREQLFEMGAARVDRSLKRYFTQTFGMKRSEMRLKPLKVGSQVIAGTILGRIGRTRAGEDPHVLFVIRPAGRGAPRIDPKPILDGWKLLESTAIYRAAGKNPFFGPDAKNLTVGQVLMMSKEALQRRLLADPRVEIYECGRRDIRAGIIDRRVLATVEFLASSGLKPTITSLRCGHGYLTASGNVSEHSSGDAVDIAKVNGIPILGHQGEGSITDITIRRLLTLQGAMRPHQIISLMTFPGADNTLALPDHADHIHVGFRPLYQSNSKLGRRLGSVLKPGQWIKLIDRLGQIDNPVVRPGPARYTVKVGKAGGGTGD